MEIHAHVPRPGKNWSHWLLEGTLILVSVLLAFAVGQFREERGNHEMAGHALRSIQAEIRANVQKLEPMTSWHERWLSALESATAETSGSSSAIEVWFRTRPPFPAGVTFSFPSLKRSAWDAAVNGGLLRLIDYDVSATLSDVYRAQEIVTDNVERLANGPLALPTTFDPANRLPSVRMLWLTLADIQSAEATLLKNYQSSLPEIQNAVSGY